MIPQDLLRLINKGDVLLVVGDRLALDSEGRSLLERLTNQLGRELSIDNFQDAALPKVAQMFVGRNGRPALQAFIQKWMDEQGQSPHPTHHLIAELMPFQVIVTTNFDTRLEQAMAKRERPFNVNLGRQETTQDPQETQLYKLYGSLDDDDSLVLTEVDTINFLQNPDSISLTLKAYLARKTLLFLGFDLNDHYFTSFYHKVTTGLDNLDRKNFALSHAGLTPETGWYYGDRIEPILADPMAFLNELKLRLEELQDKSDKPEPLAAPSLSRPPYRGLSYFEADDEKIFVGRDKEVKDLGSLIHGHRIVLLDGPSGVGKTSLLLAGVQPFLKHDEPAYEILYTRITHDPLQAIQDAVNRKLNEQLNEIKKPAAKSMAEVNIRTDLRDLLCHHFDLSELKGLCFELGVNHENLSVAGLDEMARELILHLDRRSNLPALVAQFRHLRPQVTLPDSIANDPVFAPPDQVQGESLTDFLYKATQSLNCTFVVILDQFEEFFIHFDKTTRARFIAELRKLDEARHIPIKIVLSLRKDWLGAMHEVKEQIRQVFDNWISLEPLSPAQARQAITEPVRPLGISYEAELVDKLLAHLLSDESSEAIMPTQLQLVCLHLYNQLESDESVITLAAYEQAGEARGILREYLRKQLGVLLGGERAIAQRVLEELVTPEGTKRKETLDFLAFSIDVDRASLEPILTWLEEARLLTVIKDEDGQRHYELVHEYLIPEIDHETQERKRIEELIEREVEYRAFARAAYADDVYPFQRSLLSPDKLKDINKIRDSLRLDASAQEMLLRSALVADDEVDYWLARVDDNNLKAHILFEAINSGLSTVQQHALRLLGQVVETQLELTGAFAQSLTKLLIDEDQDVRQAALETLEQTQRPNTGLATAGIAESLAWLIRKSDFSPDERLTEIFLHVVMNQPDMATFSVSECLARLLAAANDMVRDRLEAILAIDKRVKVSPALKALVGPGRNGGTTPKIKTKREPLAAIIDANPELSLPLARVLVALLTVDIKDLRLRTRGVLVFVVDSHPHLALQVADGLNLLLQSSEERHFIGSVDVLNALGDLGQRHSKLATRIIDMLLPHLKNENRWIREATVEMMIQIVTSNHDSVNLQAISEVMNNLGHGNPDVRATAVTILGYLGESSLEAATQCRHELLQHLKKEEDKGLRYVLVYALAQIYAYEFRSSAAEGEKKLAQLFNKLTDKANALEWPVAANALFLISLHSAAESQTILNHLNGLLAASQELEAHKWFNRTWRMIQLAQTVHATQQDPTLKVETVPALEKQLISDLRWAAQKALAQLA